MLLSLLIHAQPQDFSPFRTILRSRHATGTSAQVHAIANYQSPQICVRDSSLHWYRPRQCNFECMGSIPAWHSWIRWQMGWTWYRVLIKKQKFICTWSCELFISTYISADELRSHFMSVQLALCASGFCVSGLIQTWYTACKPDALGLASQSINSLDTD